MVSEYSLSLSASFICHPFVLRQYSPHSAVPQNIEWRKKPNQLSNWYYIPTTTGVVPIDDCRRAEFTKLISEHNEVFPGNSYGGLRCGIDILLKTSYCMNCSCLFCLSSARIRSFFRCYYLCSNPLFCKPMRIIFLLNDVDNSTERMQIIIFLSS